VLHTHAPLLLGSYNVHWRTNYPAKMPHTCRGNCRGPHTQPPAQQHNQQPHIAAVLATWAADSTHMTHAGTPCMCRLCGHADQENCTQHKTAPAPALLRTAKTSCWTTRALQTCAWAEPITCGCCLLCSFLEDNDLGSAQDTVMDLVARLQAGQHHKAGRAAPQSQGHTCCPTCAAGLNCPAVQCTSSATSPIFLDGWTCESNPAGASLPWQLCAGACAKTYRRYQVYVAHFASHHYRGSNGHHQVLCGQCLQHSPSPCPPSKRSSPSPATRLRWCLE
jgi:hypothetical protein